MVLGRNQRAIIELSAIAEENYVEFLRLLALVSGRCEVQMLRTHLSERSTIFFPLSLRNLPKWESAMPEPPKLTRVNLKRAGIG
jgi:hypothetical protein